MKKLAMLLCLSVVTVILSLSYMGARAEANDVYAATVKGQDYYVRTESIYYRSRDVNRDLLHAIVKIVNRNGSYTEQEYGFLIPENPRIRVTFATGHTPSHYQGTFDDKVYHPEAYSIYLITKDYADRYLN